MGTQGSEPKWVEAGARLRELRKTKKLSVFKVAKVLNISGNYLSEIERGLKPPSDMVLLAIAEYYNLDKTELFAYYDRIVPEEKELLLGIPSLRKTITHLSVDDDLTDEEKDFLSNQLYDIYQELVKKRTVRDSEDI